MMDNILTMASLKAPPVTTKASGELKDFAVAFNEVIKMLYLIKFSVYSIVCIMFRKPFTV